MTDQAPTWEEKQEAALAMVKYWEAFASGIYIGGERERFVRNLTIFQAIAADYAAPEPPKLPEGWRITRNESCLSLENSDGLRCGEISFRSGPLMVTMERCVDLDAALAFVLTGIAALDAMEKGDG